MVYNGFFAFKDQQMKLVEKMEMVDSTEPVNTNKLLS